MGSTWCPHEVENSFSYRFFFGEGSEKCKYLMMTAGINYVHFRDQNFSITSTKKPRDLPEKSCKNRGFLNTHAVKNVGGTTPPRVGSSCDRDEVFFTRDVELRTRTISVSQRNFVV